MDARLRWGILGTGKIARIMAEAIAASRDADLVAVGSRDAERAASFAATFEVERSHDRYEGVFDDQVDVVYVATHHPLHRTWAVRAAEAGKHVLCEKPLAVHHADAVEVVEAARGNGVFLLEAFAYRSHPQTQRLVELLRGGAIGEPRVVDAVFGYDAGPTPGNYLLAPELAGGSVLDVGCYTTSMAHLVASTSSGRPREASEVTGSGRLGPSGVDLTAAGTVSFEDGPLARMACSIEANLDGAVRIVGSEGRITVPSPWLPGRIGTEARIVLERWGSAPEVIEIPIEADVYTLEVGAVNEFVRKGELDPSVLTWEESLANMRTLDRWRAAIGLRYPGLE